MVCFIVSRFRSFVSISFSALTGDEFNSNEDEVFNWSSETERNQNLVGEFYDSFFRTVSLEIFILHMFNFSKNVSEIDVQIFGD